MNCTLSPSPPEESPQLGHGRYAVIVALLPISTDTCLAPKPNAARREGLNRHYRVDRSLGLDTVSVTVRGGHETPTGTLPILNHYILANDFRPRNTARNKGDRTGLFP